MMEHPENDPLGDLLGDTAQCQPEAPSEGGPRLALRAGHDALREAIWRQTSGVLRRRRVVRRGFVLLALAGCYAVGLLTTGALRAPQQSVQIVAYHSIQQTPAPAPP